MERMRKSRHLSHKMGLGNAVKLGNYVNEAKHNFVLHSKLCTAASSLQRLPTEVFNHLTRVAGMAVVSYINPGGSTLDCF